MKYIYSKLSIALLLFSFLIIPVTAQNNDDNDIDNGVISSAGRQGFSFQTKNKKFLFKPYALIQIAGKFNYYDDEGLNLADQDKIANSGFAIPKRHRFFRQGIWQTDIQLALNCIPKRRSIVTTSLVRCKNERGFAITCREI